MMLKVILYLHTVFMTEEGGVHSATPDLIGRRVRWPVLPRKGEEVWVSETTDCSYEVDRVVHILNHHGYTELHFKVPEKEVLGLMEVGEGWKDTDDHSVPDDYWNWYKDE